MIMKWRTISVKISRMFHERNANNYILLAITMGVQFTITTSVLLPGLFKEQPQDVIVDDMKTEEKLRTLHEGLGTRAKRLH